MINENYQENLHSQGWQPQNVIAAIFSGIESVAGKSWLHSKFAPYKSAGFTMTDILHLDERTKCFTVSAEFFVFIQRQIDKALWQCVCELAEHELLGSRISHPQLVPWFGNRRAHTVTLKQFDDEFCCAPTISLWNIRILIERVLPRFEIIVDLVVMTTERQYCEQKSVRWGEWIPGWTGWTGMNGEETIPIAMPVDWTVLKVVCFIENDVWFPQEPPSSVDDNPRPIRRKEASSNVNDTITVCAESSMLRQEISHRQCYDNSIALLVRSGVSVKTAAKGDCFIISLLFGICFAKGTQWLFQKLQPLLGEGTAVTAANMLCISSGMLEIHDEVANKLRAALKSEVLIIEEFIKAKVEDGSWTCDAVDFGRNWESCILSYYAEQICDFKDNSRSSTRRRSNFGDILACTSSPTVEFINHLFDWIRVGNINVNGKIDVGSPRQYTRVKDKMTQKNSIFFPTCYNDIIILQILPKYGISVNLVVDGIFSAHDPETSAHPATGEYFGGWNVKSDEVVEVIVRYERMSRDTGHYEPICPEFLDKIEPVDA